MTSEKRMAWTKKMVAKSTLMNHMMLMYVPYTFLKTDELVIVLLKTVECIFLIYSSFNWLVTFILRLVIGWKIISTHVKI
jgi:hypothetical protein